MNNIDITVDDILNVVTVDVTYEVDEVTIDITEQVDNISIEVIEGSGGAGTVTWNDISDRPTTLDGFSDGTTNRVFSTAEKSKLTAISGVNTGDETSSTIKSKLGAASAGADGYLSGSDWSSFSGKQNSLGYTPIPNTRTVNSKSLNADITLTQDDISDGTNNKVFTSTEKTKLSGIAAGAEVNVNADWNSSSGDSQILNKPTIPTALSQLSDDSSNRRVSDTEKTTWNGKQDSLGFTPVPTTRTINSKALSANISLTQDDIGDGTTNKVFTSTEQTKLSGIATGAEVNVNADWNAASGDAQILNKPTIPSQYTDELAQDAVGTILTDTSTIDFTYTDATPSITADVKDESITLAKMANMATGSLIYRKTALAGVPEVQTLATLKTDLGLTGINSGDQTLAGLGGVATSVTVNGHALTGNISVTASDVGLGNVTNESKATMFTNPAFTGTPTGITATHVGLGNVTNESKATILTSPAITGTPTGITATHVGLGSVTNNAQVKKIASSVSGNLVSWNGTTGDTPADSGILATNVSGHIGSTSNPHSTSDANLVTTDVTTNNVSTSKHGFFPKLPNTGAAFFRDDGTWQAVSGGSLPDQSGHNGQYLGTDGSTAFWSSVTSTASPKAVTTKIDDYSVSPADGVILCNCSNKVININLFTAVGNTGNEKSITKIDPSSNYINVVCFGSETINGETSMQIGNQYTTMSIISNGTNWNII